MRRAPALLLLAALAACAHRTRTVLLDDDGSRPPPQSPAMKARSDHEALDAVKRRAETGTLDPVLFEPGSAEIPADAYPALDLVARLMSSEGRLKLLLRAYAGDPADADEDRDLSERRASAVKAYLVLKGVPPPSVRLRVERERAKSPRVELHATSREWNAVY